MTKTKLVLAFIWNLISIFCAAFAIDYLLHSDNVWIRITCVLPAYSLWKAYEEMQNILSNKD